MTPINPIAPSASAPATPAPATAPPTSAAGRCPFPAAECDVFHAQDRHAATAVVGIMITIFVLAVVGYTFVAFLAASSGG
jgi:hypothetical protein